MLDHNIEKNKSQEYNQKNPKTLNVVKALFLFLDKDKFELDIDLNKRLRQAIFEVVDAYYVEGVDFNNLVEKSVFYLSLIRDKSPNLRDKCELLIRGLNYIKDTQNAGPGLGVLEGIMSLGTIPEVETVSKRLEIHAKGQSSDVSIRNNNRETVKIMPPKSELVLDSAGLRKNGRKSDILSQVTSAPQSIKDIANRISGCSEKTVQRELNNLLEEGLIQRIGEKRWSKYLLN
jgi:hypothetical protein